MHLIQDYAVENRLLIYFYEQQIKRELKEKHISGCRCNERLKAKTDGSKHLTYTGLHGDLEHLTIETRLIQPCDEDVANLRRMPSTVGRTDETTKPLVVLFKFRPGT